MREIEFRGKKEILTEENKKYTDGWIYSDTLYKDDNGVYLIPLGVSAESYHLGKYNFRANSDRFEIMVAKIKPETLGQYTGLKDKNGTKIFEGDIIKGTIVSAWAKDVIVCVVEYQKDGFVSISENKWKHKLMFAKDIEVIGNIYDNPDLLEVDDV